LIFYSSVLQLVRHRWDRRLRSNRPQKLFSFSGHRLVLRAALFGVLGLMFIAELTMAKWKSRRSLLLHCSIVMS